MYIYLLTYNLTFQLSLDVFWKVKLKIIFHMVDLFISDKLIKATNKLSSLVKCSLGCNMITNTPKCRNSYYNS